MPDGEHLPARIPHETFVSILATVSCGESANAFLREINLNPRTFWACLANDPVAANLYAQARARGLERWADEIHEIADRAGEDVGSTNKARLQIDSRKWLLSKLAPKKYGDHIDIAVSATRTGGQLDERELAAIALNRALPVADSVS